MTSIPDLVKPGVCAVVCHEMQRGVVGDLASPDFPTARAVAESGIVGSNAKLFAAARANDIRVIHCAAAFRKDRAGSFANTPMLEALLDNPGHLVAGTPAVDPVPELWSEDLDVVMHRFHGMSSFAGTELDWLLRSLHATTVIVTGVSVNRGVTGQTLEAVNYGYRVVIPTDCVIGYPKEYSDAVLEHTLAPLSWLTTSDEIVGAWQAVPASTPS
jgi:nicotinamidase-related amidase